MNSNTKFLSHLAYVEDLDAILKDGLKCDPDGYVYLFEDVDYTDPIGVKANVRDHIALNQMGAFHEVALLKINVEGWLSKLEPDKIAESSAKFQHRIKIDVITPDRIVSSEIIKPNNPWKEFFEGTK